MKKLLCALCLLAASTVHAGEWLYIDVIVCEAPPDPIRWVAMYVEVSIWDEANPTEMVLDTINPSLGGQLYYSDHYLPGIIDVWNAWISPGKRRVYGYDGKWYQIRWQSVSAYDNDMSNFSTLHLNFDWRIDPDQSAKPDETTALRRNQWQEAW